MSRMRFGQLLAGMGKLPGHDIEEILHEQSAPGTKKSFGQIALTLGLVEPRHIWQAWADQLSEGWHRIDLRTFGVDAQAVSRLPRDLAVRCCAMPLRLLEAHMIIAISDPAYAPLFDQERLHLQLRFVLTDARQIDAM